MSNKAGNKCWSPASNKTGFVVDYTVKILIIDGAVIYFLLSTLAVSYAVSPYKHFRLEELTFLIQNQERKVIAAPP